MFGQIDGWMMSFWREVVVVDFFGCRSWFGYLANEGGFVSFFVFTNILQMRRKNEIDGNDVKYGNIEKI